MICFPVRHKRCDTRVNENDQGLLSVFLSSVIIRIHERKLVETILMQNSIELDQES